MKRKLNNIEVGIRIFSLFAGNPVVGSSIQLCYFPKGISTHFMSSIQ